MYFHWTVSTTIINPQPPKFTDPTDIVNFSWWGKNSVLRENIDWPFKVHVKQKSSSEEFLKFCEVFFPNLKKLCRIERSRASRTDYFLGTA